jgi:Na+-transporting NADH:ubiquinone oxidoreductase subunit F
MDMTIVIRRRHVHRHRAGTGVYHHLRAYGLLVSSGDVNIEINGEKTITVPAGGKLLQTLSESNIFLASACGGGGTCAQCKCIVDEGGGAMLPTEESHLHAP